MCPGASTHLCFFFSSRRRHTRWPRDWSSDVCSSDLISGESLQVSCIWGVDLRLLTGREYTKDAGIRRKGDHVVTERCLYARPAGADTAPDLAWERIQTGRASCREGVWCSGWQVSARA